MELSKGCYQTFVENYDEKGNLEQIFSAEGERIISTVETLIWDLHRVNFKNYFQNFLDSTQVYILSTESCFGPGWIFSPEGGPVSSSSSDQGGLFYRKIVFWSRVDFQDKLKIGPMKW